jgi:hypothetical protein
MGMPHHEAALAHGRSGSRFSTSPITRAFAQGTAPLKHNLKTGAQIPVDFVAQVDRKIDDRIAV